MASGGAPRVVSNPPTQIEYNGKKFVIMDAPTDANIDAYVQILKKNNAKVVVRACEPSYNTKPMLDAGIRVVDLPFADGDPPPTELVTEWLNLIESTLGGKTNKGETAEEIAEKKKSSIAVHCVAGLGRAPVLVCVYLVEAGMDPYDAISYVRKKRRGAINARQLQYIESYKRQRGGGCCVIA